jgi:hypothetical protein
VKKVMIASMVFAAVLTAQGLYAHGYDGLTPEEIQAAAPEAVGKKVSELTVAEWAALAGAASVAKQEDRYVGRAKFLSFVVPGTGQFIVGDTGGGFIRMGTELAIIAGTATAYWLLLPDDLQDSSLSRSERRSLMRDYWEDGDGAKVLPAMAVAAAGFTLSIVNRVLASSDAGKTARSNIESGKVVFEPKVYLDRGRFGFGIGMRMH